MPAGKSVRLWFVERFYADHARSPAVEGQLRDLFDALPPDGFALNVGGTVKLDPRVRNLNLAEGPTVDYVGNANDIPLPDESVDLVITQETLEHVPDPDVAVREMTRVLRPGGCLYLQVPFVIGFHPGPTDYWRFTNQGIVRLAESAGLKAREVGTSAGPAAGYYRISVEFFAIAFSGRSGTAYRLAKGAFSLLLYPLKSLDRFLTRSPQADRIAGGYFVVAEKV